MYAAEYLHSGSERPPAAKVFHVDERANPKPPACQTRNHDASRSMQGWAPNLLVPRRLLMLLLLSCRAMSWSWRFWRHVKQSTERKPARKQKATKQQKREFSCDVLARLWHDVGPRDARKAFNVGHDGGERKGALLQRTPVRADEPDKLDLGFDWWGRTWAAAVIITPPLPYLSTPPTSLRTSRAAIIETPLWVCCDSICGAGGGPKLTLNARNARPTIFLGGGQGCPRAFLVSFVPGPLARRLRNERRERMDGEGLLNRFVY